MSIALAMDFRMNAAETFGEWMDNSTAPTVTHRLTQIEAVNLTGSTTPQVTKAWSDRISLSGGTALIDLTALDVPGMDNVDFTGLKVQAIKFINRTANENAMEVAPDPVTGYNLFGTADDKITVPVGGAIMLYLPDGNPDVAAGAKDITITGSGSETFDIELVAG